MGPRDVDELSIWEIAVLLGVGDELNSEKDQQSPSQAGSDRKRELLRQRLAHSKGLGPKPEAKAVDPSTFASMAKALS